VGTIFWPEALLMLAAGLVGGYAGARIARRIDPAWLRIGISCLNCVITAIFFWKTYG
jgi:uncharacterized membrane protein YfcA